MTLQAKNAIGVLAMAVLMGTSLLGCGSSSSDGSERAVEWLVERPLGAKQVRLSASVKVCNVDPPLLEEPIIEHEGNRVYIELRQVPEEVEGQNGCLLQLLGAFKKITFERDLDELVLYDSSTDPPEQRWPRQQPWPQELR